MTQTKRQKMTALLDEVLGESLLRLKVRSHSLEEDLVSGTSTVRLTLGDPEREIQGKGVGIVDAAFDALIKMLVDEYPSLEHIRFVSFTVSSADGTGERDARTDAEGIARLQVANATNRIFEFTEASRSVAAASIRVTVAAVEYFVNSERAFFTVRGFLDEAKSTGRNDLVQHYTAMLVQLVGNSSYTPPTTS